MAARNHFGSQSVSNNDMKKDGEKEVASKVLPHLLFNYSRWSRTELLVPFIECASFRIKVQVKKSIPLYNNLSVFTTTKRSLSCQIAYVSSLETRKGENEGRKTS